MKFQVPQFIEVEDKIFGPLTLKQFIYLAGGAGLSVVFYLVAPLWLAVAFIVPIMAFSGALAFYKINNKPFIFVVESAFKYLLNPKLYIWRHQQQQKINIPEPIIKSQPQSAAFIPNMSANKLKDLSFTLDTKETSAPLVREVKK